MPRILNLVGLVISLIAAGVMYFLPVYTTPIVQDKKSTSYAELFAFTGVGKVPRWKVYLAKLGPILLAVGFLLQIIAAIMNGL